jgi:hypothetical protein
VLPGGGGTSLFPSLRLTGTLAIYDKPYLSPTLQKIAALHMILSDHLEYILGR